MIDRFTHDLIDDRYNYGSSELIGFRNQQDVVCCICHKWFTTTCGTPYATTRAIHVNHIIYAADNATFYIVPDSAHKQCREIFNICPPL